MKQLQRYVACVPDYYLFGLDYGANLKPDSKDTGYAQDERTVGMENLKLKAKTERKGQLTTNRY